MMKRVITQKHVPTSLRIPRGVRQTLHTCEFRMLWLQGDVSIEHPHFSSSVFKIVSM